MAKFLNVRAREGAESQYHEEAVKACKFTHCACSQILDRQVGEHLLLRGLEGEAPDHL